MRDKESSMDVGEIKMVMQAKFAIKLKDTEYYYNFSNGTFSHSPELFDSAEYAKSIVEEIFELDTDWKVIKFHFYEEEI